ncbi:putative maltose phosphorylase [Xylogone sp. PMI_703]|nr:putative maltose phosphorylase [Xylogone sp. PMI_703]
MKVYLAVQTLAAVSATALFESISSNIISSLQQVLQFAAIPSGPTPLQKYLSSVEETCSKLEQGKFDPVTWTITTNTFCPNHFQAAPYVANGYIGQALPAEGTGYWVEKRPDGSDAINGWPLDQPRATFGTVAGFWNLQEKVKYVSLPENVLRGGESVISGIPDWTGLVVTTEDGESYLPGVDPTTVIAYSQSWSLQDGVVHTNITWKPKRQEAIFQLNYTVLAHRTRINLGIVRLDVTVSKPVRFTITDVLDGAGAVRTHFGDKEITDQWMWTSVKPWGVETVTAYVGSTVRMSGLTEEQSKSVELSRRDSTNREFVSQNMSTIAQSWDFEFEESPCEFSIYKYASISSSDAFPKNTQSRALQTALQAVDTPWDLLLQEHVEAWNAIWHESDIIVSDIKELQILTRASLFHLLSNLRSGVEGNGLGDNSVLVGGLSSDSYAGLVFWDADVWMYPALLLLQPEYAKSINNYRTRLLPQAIENARSYGYSGALYPWTSGRYGNCTGTGLCKDYQYHLDHDIAQSHWNYYLHTKNETWLRERGWPILKNAADMFANYVSWNKSARVYETKLLGEPDEYAFNIDNGAYTNAGIKMLLGTWAPAAAKVLGFTPPRNWSTISEKIKIPYDDQENVIIEYDGMDGLVYIKQASVALINYPLGWRMSEKQAQNDLAFYAAANTADGPAMTWSMFAINTADLDETGCAAYTYLLQGSQPYIRAPFFQFSEQRTDSWHVSHFGAETNAAFPFLTAYGGFLQVFTHGFTGIRAHADALVMDPVMVPQLPNGIKLKGVKYQGAVLDIYVGSEKTIITRHEDADASKSLPLTIRLAGKASAPGDHILLPGATLTVPTRRADLNGTTIPGNAAQCAPVFSAQESVPGHMPMAAVDGSNITLWQPKSAALSSIMIDLGHSRSVSGVSVNWDRTPALMLEVWGSQERDRGYDRLVAVEKVQISEPYKPEETKIVKIRPGNITVAEFDTKMDVRFVKVYMEGTWGDDKDIGATIAEVAII